MNLPESKTLSELRYRRAFILEALGHLSNKIFDEVNVIYQKYLDNGWIEFFNEGTLYLVHPDYSKGMSGEIDKSNIKYILSETPEDKYIIVEDKWR